MMMPIFGPRPNMLAQFMGQGLMGQQRGQGQQMPPFNPSFMGQQGMMGQQQQQSPMQYGGQQLGNDVQNPELALDNIGLVAAGGLPFKMNTNSSPNLAQMRAALTRLHMQNGIQRFAGHGPVSG